MAETIKGGGFVGVSSYFGYTVTRPLSCLMVDYDAIIFKIFPLTYRIEKEFIKCLVERRILWTSSLRIVHTKSGFPKVVLFTPKRINDLDSILRRYNYQIQPENTLTEVEERTVNYSNTINALSIIAAIAGIWAALYASR